MTQAEPAPTGHPREEWLLEVVEAFDVAPRLRRVVFTAAHLDELRYQPGQALVLRMPLPEGGTGRRDYTIRWLDRTTQRLAIACSPSWVVPISSRKLRCMSSASERAALSA